jgi:hypothetical protein
MIDVYATAGTFTDKNQLAKDLAAVLMAIEGVPDIPIFRQNTAAFVHELPAGHGPWLVDPGRVAGLIAAHQANTVADKATHVDAGLVGKTPF